jgi:hypothetical protein
MVALRILTWKIMLALAVLRKTGDARHPGPLRVPGPRGGAHSSRPIECALSPLPETHGIARGHDANAVLELHENGTEATRAGRLRGRGIPSAPEALDRQYQTW